VEVRSRNKIALILNLSIEVRGQLHTLGAGNWHPLKRGHGCFGEEKNILPTLRTELQTKQPVA
jgi:hypothetical protein